ncbi:MAG: polyprenyl synthetase family protein [Elusimicrobia bacterium]|nr:polyprenyl synthetase family protein [Elusimicrobiota bacterium]
MRYRPAQEVFSRTKRFVSVQAQSPGQKRLLLTAVENLEAQLGEEEPLPFISLPLAVHAALRGEPTPALPLAVAGTLLFLGIDLLDDLADGDLPRTPWRRFPPAQVQLAATTALCALAPKALAELAAPPERIVAMQRRLAEGLLRMSAGQQQDLGFAGRARVGAQAVEESVAGKSGEEIALWAALAALLAGAPSAQIARYEDVGRAIGTAGQLASDCHDLFQAEHSRDLANGTRTLPIALHLEPLDAPARRGFMRLLDRAREDAAARAEIRRLLIEGGRLRHCAFVVEIHCQKALARLKEARPLEPAGGALREMIRQVSFFPGKTSKENTHGPTENQDADGPLDRRSPIPAGA